MRGSALTAFVRGARARVSKGKVFFSKAISHTHSKVEKKETGLKAKNALSSYFEVCRLRRRRRRRKWMWSTFLSRAGI
jgi:hypothetical protein